MKLNELLKQKKNGMSWNKPEFNWNKMNQNELD